MSTITSPLTITKIELFAPFFTRALTRLLLIALTLFLVTGCTGLNKSEEAVTTPPVSAAVSTTLVDFNQNHFHHINSLGSIGNVP